MKNSEDKNPTVPEEKKTPRFVGGDVSFEKERMKQQGCSAFERAFLYSGNQ